MAIANAPQPSRSTGTAVITFGLINIPISLYTATEETRVARSEYIVTKDGDLHKVGRQHVDVITGETVEYGDIVKCATAEDGTLVQLSDDEIAAVTGSSDGTAPIIALVGLNELLANYRVAKHYQVRPKAEKKGGAAHEQAFALLTTALAARGQAALIKLTIRKGAAQYAALLPDGTLQVLYYTDAVREERPMPAVTVGERELEMANILLDAIDTDVPEMLDVNAAAIQSYVDAKAHADVEMVVPTPDIAPATSSLEDLLAASIKAAS